MKFYIVLDSSRHPIANHLFTESDLEGLEIKPDWTIVPINPPWEVVAWSQAGGRGNSPYGNAELTSIRLPKAIALQVKKFSVWLWRSSNPPT